MRMVGDFSDPLEHLFEFSKRSVNSDFFFLKLYLYFKSFIISIDKCKAVVTWQEVYFRHEKADGRKILIFLTNVNACIKEVIFNLFHTVTLFGNPR